MDTQKLKGYMRKFSLQQLKKFLGENLVDMLIEWTPDNQPLFTKNKLADMIITVHGANILSKKEFRSLLVQKFAEQDILSFRNLLGDRYNTASLYEIIEAVASATWNRNDISLHILDILDINEDIFPTYQADEQALNSILGPDRFFELLDYQFVIKQRVINNLSSGVELNRMLIHMPTGTGKTKTAMHTIIHHYIFNLNKKGLVIWMAHTNELLYQAVETFANVWRHIGRGEVNLFRFWGNYELEVTDEPLNGFIFCGFQKLISVAKSRSHLFDKLVQDCDLIIVDEAHKAAATETKSVIDRIMTKKSNMKDRALIGLTATPGRSIDDIIDNNRLITMFDNKTITIDTEVLNMINFTKFKAQNTLPEKDIIKYFQEREILSKIKREKLIYNTDLTENELKKLRVKANANGYTDFSKEFLEVIGRNKSRNLTILNKLVELNAKKLSTIVFACSVEHGRLLSTALSLEGINNACVFGDMDTRTRAEVIRKFKDRDDAMNILINYEVLTTGFDATNIQCVFITRPTQSVVLYSQMLGRGLRGPKMGGYEECLLVDIEDNLNKFNESMAFSYFDSYWNV
ncbi:MAG: DEAD/DEAH box helicase family protein [Bacillota bacterium]|nr:DEAD/DEAH box helicase family protein [Bacillota bacterium]